MKRSGLHFSMSQKRLHFSMRVSGLHHCMSENELHFGMSENELHFGMRMGHTSILVTQKGCFYSFSVHDVFPEGE